MNCNAGLNLPCIHGLRISITRMHTQRKEAWEANDAGETSGMTLVVSNSTANMLDTRSSIPAELEDHAKDVDTPPRRSRLACLVHWMIHFDFVSGPTIGGASVMGGIITINLVIVFVFLLIVRVYQQLTTVEDVVSRTIVEGVDITQGTDNTDADIGARIILSAGCRTLGRMATAMSACAIVLPDGTITKAIRTIEDPIQESTNVVRSGDIDVSIKTWIKDRYKPAFSIVSVYKPEAIRTVNGSSLMTFVASAQVTTRADTGDRDIPSTGTRFAPVDAMLPRFANSQTRVYMRRVSARHNTRVSALHDIGGAGGLDDGASDDAVIKTDWAFVSGGVIGVADCAKILRAVSPNAQAAAATAAAGITECTVANYFLVTDRVESVTLPALSWSGTVKDMMTLLNFLILFGAATSIACARTRARYKVLQCDNCNV